MIRIYTFKAFNFNLPVAGWDGGVSLFPPSQTDRQKF